MDLIALRQAALFLLIVVGCVLLCRRVRVLMHPLSVTAAVIAAGVSASLIGAMTRGGWAEVSAVAWRSTVGSTMWKLFIGAIYGIAWAIGRSRAICSGKTSL